MLLKPALVASALLLVPKLAHAGCYEDELTDVLTSPAQEIVQHPLTGDVKTLKALESNVRRKESDSFDRQLGDPPVSKVARPSSVRKISEIHFVYDTFPSDTSIPCKISEPVK